MGGPRITDHALVRFLERAGCIDVETVRAALKAGLARAHEAACQLGESDHLISIDGLTYVVRDGAVTTVLETGNAPKQAYSLVRRAADPA